MQAVFEKIIEKLEMQKDYYKTIRKNTYCRRTEMDDCDSCRADHYLEARLSAIDDVIEIVKQEAEKFGRDTNVGSNGWIPCSEKLPELRQDVLVTVKYTGFMGMHGYWIKTGHMEAENDWWGDCAGGEVIAWKPLPLPFRDKE